MTTTIQRTGKGLKAVLFLANAIQLFGIIGVFGGLMNQNSEAMAAGLYIVGGGIALHVFGRVLIWWNHD